MTELNFNLLNTNAPADVADSFYQGQNNALARSINQQGFQENANKLALSAQNTADDAATRKAFQDSGGDYTKAASTLFASGQYAKAMAFQKAQQDQLKAQRENQTGNIDLQDKKTNYIGKVFGYVKDNPTYENLSSAVDHLASPAVGIYTPDQATQIKTMAQTDPSPDKIKDFATQMFQRSIKSETQMPKIISHDSGDVNTDYQYSPFTQNPVGAIITTPKSVTPEGQANRAAKEAEDAKKLAAGSEPSFSPETLTAMGRQARTGDLSVFTNVGRGTQGSANLRALREEITRQQIAAGETGEDMAAKVAEFNGIKAGQRAVGTRTANIEIAATEAENIIPLARAASAAVPRGEFLPFGKIQVLIDNNLNDPAYRQLAQANNAVINTYARVISPTGVPNVEDKKEARLRLTEAFSDTSYGAALDMIENEIKAARASPDVVRKGFTQAVTGRKGAAAPATTSQNAPIAQDNAAPPYQNAPIAQNNAPTPLYQYQAAPAYRPGAVTSGKISGISNTKMFNINGQNVQAHQGYDKDGKPGWFVTQGGMNYQVTE